MGENLATRLHVLGTRGVDLLTNIVFPATCAGCGAAGDWICARCASQLVSLDRISDLAQHPNNVVDGDFVARYAYAEPIRRAIHLLKYEGERARAEWFAATLEPLVRHYSLNDAAIEPVPLSPHRVRRRGFNQSAEIAQHLRKLTGLPVTGHLRRIRDTKPQVELTGLERIVNVRGAFEADPQIAGQHIILIDDVITTGATMRECTSACLAAGAQSVVGVAVAIGRT